MNRLEEKQPVSSGKKSDNRPLSDYTVLKVSEDTPESVGNGGQTALLAIGSSALLVLLGTFYLFGGPIEGFKWLEERVKDGAEAVEAAGPFAPLYFSGLYLVSTIFLLPASFLTIGAGYIFGTLKGTAIVSAASTTGAALAFLIARYLARPIVAKKLAGNSKFDLVDRAIAEDGWKIVFLWRLSPLFPFGLSNYMFGLTGVSFWSYVGASWVAMLPATFTYVYLGSAGRATVDAISSDGSVEPTKLALYVVGAVATLLVTREVSTRASRALERAEQEREGESGGNM